MTERARTRHNCALNHRIFIGNALINDHKLLMVWLPLPKLYEGPSVSYESTAVSAILHGITSPTGILIYLLTAIG